MSLLRKRGASGVQVHREFFRALHGVDEFTVAASEIEHRIRRLDEFAEPVADQHGPNLFAVFEIVGKARTVNALKVFGAVGTHFFRQSARLEIFSSRMWRRRDFGAPASRDARWVTVQNGAFSHALMRIWARKADSIRKFLS